MGTYGELVRELRIKKGVAQKELYGEIMSKSYSIRFEQGKHDISFFLIQQILDRLGMELDEFMYIHHSYNESETEQFYNEYSQKGNANDLEGLRALYAARLRLPDTYQNRLKIAELSARIDQLTYYNVHGVVSKNAISEETLRIIHHYMDNIQTWTLNELRFFANTLDFIDYERKSEYFKSILPALERYKNFQKSHRVICTLLINEIHELIMSGELDVADIFLAKLDEFSNSVEAMFFRNAHAFYTGMLLTAYGNSDLGKPYVEQAINTYYALGYPHQAKLCTSFYQQLQQSHQTKRGTQ